MSIEILDITAKPAILAWFRAVVFQVTEFGAATARARHPGRGAPVIPSCAECMQGGVRGLTTII